MICTYCYRHQSGNPQRIKGWTIRDMRRANPIEYRVCTPCEKLVGESNMALAGYRKNASNKWRKQ